MIFWWQTQSVKKSRIYNNQLYYKYIFILIYLKYFYPTYPILSAVHIIVWKSKNILEPILAVYANFGTNILGTDSRNSKFMHQDKDYNSVEYLSNGYLRRLPMGVFLKMSACPSLRTRIREYHTDNECLSTMPCLWSVKTWMALKCQKTAIVLVLCIFFTILSQISKSDFYMRENESGMRRGTCPDSRTDRSTLLQVETTFWNSPCVKR